MAGPTSEEPPLRVLAVSRKATDRTMAPTWRLRVELLIEPLTRHGVEVTPASLPTDPRSKRRFLASHRGYDVCWLHRHLAWPWEVAPLRATSRRLVFDYDDPVCFRSEGPDYWSLTRWLRFRATLRRADAVIAATARLEDLARPHCPRVLRSPLAIEASRVVDRPTPRHEGEPFRLVWIGSPSTFAYLEQIRPHLSAMAAQMPGTELMLVGPQTIDVPGLTVRYQPWSPEAERSALEIGNLGLVPLPDNPWAWGKATLKPLQYLSAGIPFLGSPIGVNRELARGSGAGILADSPEEWAGALEALARDEPKRMAMGRAGAEWIRSEHAPDLLASRVAQLFREILRVQPNRRASASSRVAKTGHTSSR